MKRAVAAMVAAGLAAAGATGAGADPAARRKIAVLEFRGGSAELPGVGGRVAEILRQRTGLAVIDADGVRAQHPDLESELSRCDGEARCVARLGARLGAAEVLLVGVAEFGDIILTLQRIDVARARVEARVAEAVSPGAAPPDADVETWLRRVLPETDFRRFGIIRIAADIAGAQVTVGGRARGLTPVSPLRVPAPASYDIRVEKAGHIGFRASVAVPPDAEVLVRAELAEEGGPRPWYARWWVLAAGGAVVVGGIATAVLLTRDDSDDVPVRVNPF